MPAETYRKINYLNLGKKPEITGYDPELELNRIKSGKTENPFAYISTQVETALRERYRTAKSFARFLIDGSGRVSSEFFKNEPFRNMLEKGVEYRKKMGSKELMREQAELKGWDKIVEKMIDPHTPDGFRTIVVSGPGLTLNSPYSDNFVDIYELKKKPGQIPEINEIRYSSGLSYENYFDRLQKLNPDYFQESNMPIDAWMLSHPIFMDPDPAIINSDQLFNEIFKPSKKTTDEKSFQEIFAFVRPYLDHYFNTLNSSKYSPIETAKAWNTIIHKADFAKESIEKTGEVNPEHLNYLHILSEIQRLGTKKTTVLPSGCGQSKGIDLTSYGLSDPAKDFLKNSVAQFSLADQDDKRENKWFICPKCDYHASGPVGDTCPMCGITAKKYQEEGGKICV